MLATAGLKKCHLLSTRKALSFFKGMHHTAEKYLLNPAPESNWSTWCTPPESLVSTASLHAHSRSVSLRSKSSSSCKRPGTHGDEKLAWTHVPKESGVFPCFGAKVANVRV